MHRIDAEGNDNNLFTEGDPQTSVPATVVSADWLNDVQEEIIEVIEEMGIALAKGTRDQFYNSILELFARGGRKLPFQATIANNTGPADVLDDNNASATFEIDRTVHKMIQFDYLLERKTDTHLLSESGRVSLVWDSKNNVFLDPRVNSQGDFSDGDDGGVVFTLAQVGVTDAFKLQYTSTDLTGTSYTGKLDITNVVKIKQ